MKLIAGFIVACTMTISAMQLTDGRTAAGWLFSDGGEIPGAKGKLEATKQGISLKADFSGGGAYVAAVYCGPMPAMPRQFTFQLDVPEPTTIVLRIKDGNDRTFQTSQIRLRQGKQRLCLKPTAVHWAHSWPAATSDPTQKTMKFPLKTVDLCIVKSNVKERTLMINSLDAEATPTEAVTITHFHMPGDVKPGQLNEVRFTADKQTPLILRPMVGDYSLGTASEVIVIAQPGVNKVQLKLPEHLGSSGLYRLELCDAVHRKPIAQAPLHVQMPTPPAVPSITGLTRSHATMEIGLDAPVPGVIMVQLFIDGKLQEVKTQPFPQGIEKVTLQFDETWKDIPAERQALAKIMVAPGKQDSLTGQITWKPKKKGSPNQKPMNCGVFTDRFGTTHPWYMNRKYEYVLDGKVYFPVGGMWCPHFVAGGRGGRTDEENRERLEMDQKVLRQIKEGGLNDVYLNSGRGAIHAIQYFVDMLEREGFEYGMQHSAGYSIPEGLYIDSFFLNRKPLSAIYRQGCVKLSLPKEQKCVGFLFVNQNNPQHCHYVDFHDSVGNAEREQTFDLDTGKDLRSKRTVSINAILPFHDDTPLLIIPKIKAKMTHFNLWNPELRRKLQNEQTWITSVEWGPGLRYWIDPIMNETHMLLDTENLRQHTTDINRDFAEWLRNRYQTEEKLAAAWNITVDWNTASRLVPQRMDNTILLLDPETGSVYTAPLLSCQMHLDYNRMIRETYSRHVDQFAQFLKNMVNVPVLDKNVGAYGSPVHCSQLYGGVDGAGFEVYLNQGLPQENNGGATRATAEAASHTMWKIGTELGHSAAIGNDGVKFFRNEAEMRWLTDSLSSMGVKGFLFFGFELQPLDRWANHSFNRFPEAMTWVSQAEKWYRAHKTAITPTAYAFPPNPCNLGRAGMSRFNVIYDDSPSDFRLSVRIRDQEWASLTEVMPQHMERLFIHLPAPPFSLHYAGQVMTAMKNAEETYVLGKRKDLGTLPDIDRYYTREVITFPDASTAQVLTVPDGAEVLAEEDGKPWAIRHGKMIIVSREPILLNNNRAQTGFRFLRPEWIRDRNYFASGDPTISVKIIEEQLGLVSNDTASNQINDEKAEDFVLPVAVRNMTGKTEDFNFCLKLPEKAVLRENFPPFRLEPGKSRTVVAKLSLTDALKHHTPVTVTVWEKQAKCEPVSIQLAQRQWTVADVVPVNELEQAPWMEIKTLTWTPVNLKTPNIKAKFRLGYKTDKLIVDLEVQDKIHVPADKPDLLWLSDSIQMAISPLIDGDVSQGDFAEIGAADSPNGFVCFGFSALPGGKVSTLEKTKGTFQRHGEHSRYRLELDAKELNLPDMRPGAQCAFSILVNSNDGSGRCGFLHWGNGIGDSKNPEEFNLIRFK